MTELSLKCRNLMASWFAMGANSDVTSHAPHETLTKHFVHYQEARHAGLVTEEPFNTHGSLTIKPTQRGTEVARERFREQMLVMARGGDLEKE